MTTLHDLHQTIGGRLLPEGAARDATAAPLGRIVTDSRQVERGDVFWALKGPHHDGSHFAAEAFDRGAAGVVAGTSVEAPDGRWALAVDDTQQALRQWAESKRRRFTGTVIAVTGSVGKTTTRQMIHTVLRGRLSGSASPQNYNNHVGLPLSMLAIEPCHDYAVLELGANRRGEIASLAGLCSPKVGVITQVADAHLGGFGSRQAIADAKAELLAALPPDGHAVLGDDPWLRSVAARCAAPITWIGTSSACDVRAVDVQCRQGRISFQVAFGREDEGPEARGQRPETNREERREKGDGRQHATSRVTLLPTPHSPPPPSPFLLPPSNQGTRFSVPVWGRHHLTAALAAVAVGRLMGFDLTEMAAALEQFEPVPMRCEVIEIRGATIINDAYNSCPTAMRAALALLRDLDLPGRRIVVCGDMGELGEQATSLHWQLGKEIVQLGQAELLIVCGEFARHVAAGARAAGLVRTRVIPCDTVDDALPFLGQAIQPGDVVLVKGSRMMGMERVIEALQRYPQRRTA